MQLRILIAGVVMLLALPVSAEPGAMGMGKEMGQAMVMLSAPADGAILAQDQPITVIYQAAPGPTGDHVHLYINGKRVAVLNQLSGSYNVGMLNPGMHKISVEIVSKSHQPIGVGKEISVDVR